jgi:mannose-6-phosphate isomerase
MLAHRPSPVLLPPNFVWRSYRGGRELQSFRETPCGGDNNFPEDWLASTVRARNGAHSQGADEGLSKVMRDGNLVLLTEWLREEQTFWFGKKLSSSPDSGEQELGVLWKLLDSSVRLQFQAHPSAVFARQHLNGNAGKTECWYILATRGEAFVYLGFQKPPAREAWARMIREQRVDEMTACFDRIPVRPGDCFVVPAGTPHAIGAGVFMLELMESTDWVVRCETTNAGVTLAPEQCFMGVGLDACLDIFDYRSYAIDEVRRRFQQAPRRIAGTETDNYLEEEIISPPWHHFFRLHRLRGRANAPWAGNELLLAIVVNGRGEFTFGGGTQPACAGQTWLLPGAVEHWEWRSSGQPWEVLLLKLPVI